MTGGGTRGIGRATDARLASEGAHVVITGRRKTELDEAVESIGPAVTAVPGGITDPADLDRLYDVVRERGKGLDVLFANVGAAAFATLEDSTMEHFDRFFAVNVKGTLATVQKALPLLNEGASVILNGSNAAEQGTPAFGAYAACKAAIRSFARTWANELIGRGIRVNSISPGPVDTSGLAELFGENKASIVDALPIARLGRPEEVAAAVAFLASADSSYIVGTDLYLDGGQSRA
ncbi:SDR family NAD(P)-dependent oxidoreductase [Streptomyces chartreusis]|uniref:SDR family NAD(P)-dependent oxidoreductase n=1 Tax=Streptomyces chartreusis TaxID=1969 RepID=UPI00369EEADC